MSAKISHAELTLLQYLHEHSGHSDERIWLDPKPIIRGLGISMNQLAKDSASLAVHGLAGFRAFRKTDVDAAGSGPSAVWITRNGEDYLRRSRLEPP